MTTSLLDLPQELVVEILSETDPVTLFRSASILETSKVLRQILCGSSRLLCTIETYLDGSEEVHKVRDHAELLRNILCHRNAWRFLDWSLPRCIAFSQSCKAYELVGGVFAQMGQNLQLIRLPTRHKERYMMHDMSFPFEVRDFAMDPTQDVIALLEDGDVPFFGPNPRVIRIHVRTISTNADHPHSRHNPLEFHILPDPSLGNGIRSALMQIVCDVLAIFFTRGPMRSRVLIWNWKDGNLLYDSGIDGLPLDTSDFVLLDQTSFIVTTIKNAGSIILYKLHSSRFFLKTLNPSRVAAFLFPSIESTSRLTFLHTHAGPIEANPLPDITLKRTDRNRIHVFTLSYAGPSSNGVSSVPSFGMYIHQNMFSSYLKNWAQLPGGDINIEWDDWGPQNTRLVPNRSPSHWLRYAHGQRVIYPHPGSRIIEIMDFSLAACFEKSASFLYSKYPCQTGGELVSALMKIPKTLSSGSPTNLSTSYSSLVLPPTVLKASPMSAFRTDVETRLPCRVSRKALPTTYYAHMLYEEGIVGIQMEQANLKLHVYSI